MGVVDACCWGPLGARCCNIISLVGFVYFGFSFLVFSSQKNFYEFHMQDPDSTRLSMLITALLYLVCFVATCCRVRHLDGVQQHEQQEKADRKNRASFMRESLRLADQSRIPQAVLKE